MMRYVHDDAEGVREGLFLNAKWYESVDSLTV